MNVKVAWRVKDLGDDVEATQSSSKQAISAEGPLSASTGTGLQSIGVRVQNGRADRRELQEPHICTKLRVVIVLALMSGECQAFFIS